MRFQPANQTDQSSLKTTPTAARSVLEQRRKQTHRSQRLTRSLHIRPMHSLSTGDLAEEPTQSWSIWGRARMVRMEIRCFQKEGVATAGLIHSYCAFSEDIRLTKQFPPDPTWKRERLYKPACPPPVSSTIGTFFATSRAKRESAFEALQHLLSQA